MTGFNNILLEALEAIKMTHKATHHMQEANKQVSAQIAQCLRHLFTNTRAPVRMDLYVYDILFSNLGVRIDQDYASR